MAFSSHAMIFVEVGLGSLVELSEDVEVLDALADALELEDDDESLDPPRIAENSHQISASTVRMMSTNANRRSQ